VHATIIDFTGHLATAVDLMETLGLESLPALIVSLKLVNLRKPKKEDTITIKREAIETLAKHGKLWKLLASIRT